MERTSPTDLLTTTQAAEIIGCSRQHVVNLCNRGEIPFTMVGRHRRISRRNLDRDRSPVGLRREEALALWWGRVVAAHVAQDPDRVLGTARSELAHLGKRHPESRLWLRTWQRVIDRGPEAVMSVLTSSDQLAIDLRATSPFIGVVPLEVRDRVVSAFQMYWRNEGA